MNFLKYIVFLVIFTVFSQKTIGQVLQNMKAEIELDLNSTSNQKVPFWMRSNQFGSIPLKGPSASFLGRASKPYFKNTDSSSKLMDWAFGFEGRINGGNRLNTTIIEAYLKGRLGVFQLQIGRTKDVMGLNGDTSLSSGNFAVSGNSLGIPNIEISIPEYYRLPVANGLISIKGNFLHGWLGKTNILSTIYDPEGNPFLQINDTKPKSYFHQKSLYIRLGKDDWKLNLYGGFNHQVYWGNEKKVYGDKFKLSAAETFLYVATGKAYGAPGVPTSKIGNQLGSLDFGIEYAFNTFNLMLYRQNFYDVGALSKLANIADGLNGITIKNTKKTFNTNFHWRTILLEFFYSKDQAGYPWSTFTKSGDEDYYNNFYYINGWSYKNRGVGSPLITQKTEARLGQASSINDYFINNRVSAIHVGAELDIYKWLIKAKTSYSRNFGTFGTSIYGNSTGSIRNPQTSNIFQEVDQLSFYLEASTNLRNGLRVGFASALDQGKLLDNSIGLSLKVTKKFN